MDYQPADHSNAAVAPKIKYVVGNGFGVDPKIFRDSSGLANAASGLGQVASNAVVQKATIIAPHVFGPQVTGEQALTEQSMPRP